MSSSNLQNEWASSYLSGGSMAYVDSLYEDYLADPDSVPADWRAVFSALPKVNGSNQELSHRDIREYFLQNADKKAAHVVQSGDSHQYEVASLINDFRALGHLAASLDPLEMTERPAVPNLDLNYHNLTNVDKNRKFFAGTSFNGPEMALNEIYDALRETYCGSIGIEYMHISDTAETSWLQKKIESVRGRATFDAEKKM